MTSINVDWKKHHDSLNKVFLQTNDYLFQYLVTGCNGTPITLQEKKVTE